MGRKKTGNFTVAKSITLNLSTAAFLEEQCIKNDSKLSPYINGLVEDERRRLEKKAKSNHFYCPKCDDEQLISVHGFAKPKFVCSVCQMDLTKTISKELQI